VIRRRIAAVTCATFFLSFMTIVVVAGTVDLGVLALPATSLSDYLYAVRLCSWPPHGRQTLSATALISLLFLGPLVVMLVSETHDIVRHVENGSLCDGYVRAKMRAVKTTLHDWRFLRNMLVVGFRISRAKSQQAPITEEFAFRACLHALLSPCLPPVSLALVTPLYFSLAHLNHAVQAVRHGATVGRAVLGACSFRAGYCS